MAKANTFRAATAVARRQSSGHGGLTVLEFVGCFVAVVGGAWLGALYLGVDVKGVAVKTLNQSEILDRVPAEWRPAVPQENVMTREQVVSTLRQELGSLRGEINALRTGKGETAVAGPANTEGDAASQLPTKERTLAYWARLNEIALGEAALQQDAASTFSEPNAAKVFAIKGRVSRFAAKAVEAVPTDGVDETVVRFGRQLGLWYDHGGELYERAVVIWEAPTSPQGRTKLNDDWKQAEQHHRNEAKLLRENAVSVRSLINRVFNVDAPEFATPASPAEKAAATANAT